MLNLLIPDQEDNKDESKWDDDSDNVDEETDDDNNY